MKDLKHYFISPKRDVDHTECNLSTSEPIILKDCVISNVIALTNCSAINKSEKRCSKKKTRKRKVSSDFDSSPADIENVKSSGIEPKVNIEPTKKRRKSDIVLKASDNKRLTEELKETTKAERINAGSFSFPKKDERLIEHIQNKSTKRKKSNSLSKSDSISNGFPAEAFLVEETVDYLHKPLRKKGKTACKPELKRDSNSSKENSLCNSENEEIEHSTPENTKSLFNYFNKIDKLPDIKEKPRLIKVEALVHVPYSGGSEKYTPKSLKQRKSSCRKRYSKVDYDLITLEESDSVEINATSTSSKSWQMKVQLEDVSNNSLETVEAISDTEEENIYKQKDLSKFCEVKDNNVKKYEKKKRKLDVSNHLLETVEAKSDFLKENIQKMKDLPDSFEVQNKNVKKDERKKMKLYTDQSNDNTSTKGSPVFEDNDVIIVTEVKKEKTRVKNDGTLASFFQFGRKITLTDEQKIAKQQFLNSGIPEPVKRIITTKSIVQGKDASFPEKSHIQQKDKMNIMWNLLPQNYNFTSEDETIKNPVWTSILPSVLKFNENKIKVTQTSGATSIKELKKELNLYPISCWHKELKRLRKGNENNMWTERYRPHLSSTFLANTRSICKLKAWLTELKENSSSDSCESSSDEFVKDENKDNTVRKTVALISGLPGTGKTAAVYAIAEEIGYHVLEINASYNRSGKRILNEFSEAMQSHKVGVSKMNFAKVKKKTENPKRSLILVEDADLLFEDDEGFVSTLINLAAGSKRPIILVVNNNRAKHLSKLKNLCHSSLQFAPPSLDRLGSWLRTVSLVEGFSLSQNIAIELASTLDIRRSLLQLQLSQEKALVIKHDSLEDAVWEKIGAYDFCLVNERKKGKKHAQSLATLDIIRQNKINKGDNTNPYWLTLPEDSTSTREYMYEERSAINNLGDYELYFLKLMNVHHKPNSFQQIEKPRDLYEVEKAAFSLTNILSRRSNAMDFWPSLRQISRNEAHRLASHTKRNNRYFNYLASLGISGNPDFIQSLSSTFTYLP